MAISRRWWEPEAQADVNDPEGRARRSFDLGDLMSLAMNGGEYTSSLLAEMLCCAQYERLPTTPLFRRLPARSASVWSGTRRVHG